MATRKQIYGTTLHDPFFDHLSRYLGLGYCVFMANYYNSVRPKPTKKPQFVEELEATGGTRELKEQQKSLRKGRKGSNVLSIPNESLSLSSVTSTSSHSPVGVRPKSPF